MKILKQNENYIEEYLTYDSNSFGDQIVILVKESIDGVKTEEVLRTNPEGNWETI